MRSSSVDVVSVPVMGLHFMRRPRYTAKSYVRDGLVAMWDGIENAGFGVHDPNATTWTDLVGNATLETSASSDSWEWTGDSLWTMAVNFGANITNTNYVNALRTTYSVEYVGTVVSMVPTKYAWTMTSWASSYQRYGGLGVTYGDKYSIYCNGSASGTGLANTGVAYHAEDRVQTSYVYRMTEGNCNFYKDANLITTAVSGNATEPASMIPYMSVGGTGNDKGPSVKHHCVRLYSRALTADEISHNYAVDKERFNLT